MERPPEGEKNRVIVKVRILPQLKQAAEKVGRTVSGLLEAALEGFGFPSFPEPPLAVPKLDEAEETCVYLSQELAEELDEVAALNGLSRDEAANLLLAWWLTISHPGALPKLPPSARARP